MFSELWEKGRSVAGEPTSEDEILELADAMYDRRIDAGALERLEELLANDLACLQAYVERMNLHGDLRRRTIESAPLTQANSVMDRALSAGAARERLRSRWWMAAVTACSLCFLGTMGWMIFLKTSLPPEVGVIAGLTTDITTGDQVLDLGQVVRLNEVFTVSKGVASFQFPSVMVNLIGPAQVRLSGPGQLELLAGTVHAQVRHGGEGFTVRTPDSVVVDLGTEFSVNYIPEGNTEVHVRRGRVQASLLDRNGAAIKRLDLTAERAATFSAEARASREVGFTAEPFEKIDSTRGTITTIDGMLRTLNEPPTSLNFGALQTRNHGLVIPEQQQVVLKQALEVTGSRGPVRLPAGSRISSYLVHYEPDNLATAAPRGGVTFDGRIAAVLVNHEALSETDQMFGLHGLDYGQGHSRGLESIEDQVQISDDRSTASFYFVVAGEKDVDQVRILVLSQE